MTARLTSIPFLVLLLDLVQLAIQRLGDKLWWVVVRLVRVQAETEQADKGPHLALEDCEHH